MGSSIDLSAEYVDSGVADVLEQLDVELIGLKPVKTRIKEIAALLLVLLQVFLYICCFPVCFLTACFVVEQKFLPARRVIPELC